MTDKIQTKMLQQSYFAEIKNSIKNEKTLNFIFDYPPSS